MTQTLPAGALIKIEIEMRIPIEATETQINEWIEFEVFQSGGIEMDNPLIRNPPEPFGHMGMHWEYLGLVGRREEYDIVPIENGGRQYKVRYHRERAS